MVSNSCRFASETSNLRIGVTPYPVESRDNFAGVFPHIKGGAGFRNVKLGYMGRMNEFSSNRELPVSTLWGSGINGSASVKPDEIREI